MRRDLALTVLNVFYDAFFAVLILVISLQLLNASPGAMKPCLDYSAFFLAGRLALTGAAADAYSVARMTDEVFGFCGVRITMPWTYPPPFDLLVAPLSLLPYGVSYGLFATLAYVFYSLMLRRLSDAPGDFLIARLIALPSIFLTLICGQSGLLVAGLVGWFCLAFLEEGKGGGIPLGLLVIKPHLAVSTTLLNVFDKRFGLLVEAALTVVLLVIATTLALGAGIWPAFLHAAAEARRFLSEGAVYPLFRMVSVFAAVYTISKSLTLAVTLQGIFSLTCAWAVFHFARLGNKRVAAGVAAIVAAGFSPYAYDYDLPTLGVGAALLLPVLSVAAKLIEKTALLLLYLFALFSGLVFTPIAGGSGSGSIAEPLKEIVQNISTQRLALGGVAYAGLVCGVLYILLRHARASAQSNRIAAPE